MSRIGKQPVEVPSGVNVGINGAVVSVDGPKGKLAYTHGGGVKVVTEDGKVVVSQTEKSKQGLANFGTTRAVINNMVQGVSQGWKKSLVLSGVGYGATLKGKEIVLKTGFSHEVVVAIPEGLTVQAGKDTIDIEGADKQLVGNFAASLRKVSPPEPYLGKGIRYSDEQIRRKAGKTGK